MRHPFTLRSAPITKEKHGLERCASTINKLLARHRPETFNSSWIRKRAPRCYRFIQRKLRQEFGGIDWDRLTYALDRKFQRRWFPGKTKAISLPYEDGRELDTILNKYRDKIYAFITPLGDLDRRIRDVIGISLVRLAQKGNVLARHKLIDLVRYTIDSWMEQYDGLSRWRGYEEDLQHQVTGCIRRYRYTGSFFTYLFRTLECAGRGLPQRRVHLPDLGNTHVVYAL
jgi:hypothetical protein